MTSGKPMKRIGLLLLLLVVLGYFGLQVVRYFASPLSTVSVSEATVEDAAALSGLLVRQETVLPDVSGLLSIALGEGERVGVGQTVATIYSNADAMELQQQLSELTARKEQLEYAREAALGTGTALRLDSEIVEDLISLRAAYSAGAAVESDALIASLRTMVVQRDYASAGEDPAAELKTVESQISALSAQLSAHSTAVRAEESGIYSGTVDGYEALLTPQNVESYTPSALERLAADESVQSSVGKLITSATWYYAAAVDTETAARLTPGRTATLRFSKLLAEDLTCRVVSVGPEENGRRLAVFSCDDYLSELTQLRRLSAEVIFDSFGGLRVPKKALRVNEEGVSGVYCVVGLTARFKAVEIVYSGDDFCLVKPATDNEKQKLRVGDELILSSDELYDGKVLNG